MSGFQDHFDPANFGSMCNCVCSYRVEYFVSVSALTEFGGEGPSSLAPFITISPSPHPLSTPLQYTAVPLILVLALCFAYATYLLRRLFCRFQGLSASWFKKQKKEYQLLTQSDANLTRNMDAR